MSTSPTASPTTPTAGPTAERSPVAFDLDAPWALHPQVSVRPERFGALLYHFGTRRLSFLKSPQLLTVVRSLGDHASARAACAEAGVATASMGSYRAALGTLAASTMITDRSRP